MRISAERMDQKERHNRVAFICIETVARTLSKTRLREGLVSKKRGRCLVYIKS